MIESLTYLTGFNACLNCYLNNIPKIFGIANIFCTICGVFMERIDLALNLVEERSRLGYSRKNFAEQTGCSVESLRLYESGQVNIPADFLLAAVQLEMDIQFVFTGIHSANLNAVSDDLNKKLDDAIGKSNVENQINGNVSNAVIASSGSVVHQINTQNHVIRTRVDSKPTTDRKSVV